MIKQLLNLSLITSLITSFTVSNIEPVYPHHTTRSRKSITNYNRRGIASWYGGRFHGRRTASGRIFNKHELTAAHNRLPFGTRVRVTNVKTGKSVIVTITDTGGFGKYNREIDLSRGAFSRIAPLNQGLATVKLQVIK